MTSIYVEGLSDDLYWSMVEKMVALFSTFALSGSGWVVEKIIRPDIKFARFRKFAAHLILPSTVADNSIFETMTMPIVSIVASWHRITRIMESVLMEMSGTIILRKHSQQHITKRTFTNLWANLKCQWDLSKWKRLKTLNDMTINVFGYDKKQCYPLWVSSSESDFDMDLLLLYDADVYHYVLITDLVKVVWKLRDWNSDFVTAIVVIVSGCVVMNWKTILFIQIIAI